MIFAIDFVISIYTTIIYFSNNNGKPFAVSLDICVALCWKTMTLRCGIIGQLSPIMKGGAFPWCNMNSGQNFLLGSVNFVMILLLIGPFLSYLWCGYE